MAASGQELLAENAGFLAASFISQKDIDINASY